MKNTAPSIWVSTSRKHDRQVDRWVASTKKRKEQTNPIPTGSKQTQAHSPSERKGEQWLQKAKMEKGADLKGRCDLPRYSLLPSTAFPLLHPSYLFINIWIHALVSLFPALAIPQRFTAKGTERTNSVTDSVLLSPDGYKSDSYHQQFKFL